MLLAANENWIGSEVARRAHGKNKRQSQKLGGDQTKLVPSFSIVGGDGSHIGCMIAPMDTGVGLHVSSHSGEAIVANCYNYIILVQLYLFTLGWWWWVASDFACLCVRDLEVMYCDEYELMSVCLSAYIPLKPRTVQTLHFCACCLWLWSGPPLAPLRYIYKFPVLWVTYFHIMGPCGARYVFLCRRRIS